MKDININRKKRLIELIDNFIVVENLDMSMTITELKSKLSEDTNKYDVAKQENEQKVIKDFDGVFLKLYEEDGTFGDSLDVLYISKLRLDGYNTEYDRLYSCDGEMITFGGIGVNINELTGMNKLMSEEKLRSYTKISQKEYNQLKTEAVNLNTRLNKIIKG